MRKTLLFMASAAMIVSCTNDLLETEVAKAPAALGEGITFQVVQDETRGMIDTDHTAFFFAEQDRISVWARNAKKGWPITAPTSNNQWGTFDFTSGGGNVVTYKATSSEGYPDYTAISDADMLNLNDYSTPANKSDFFVAYPAVPLQTVTFAGNKFTIKPGMNLMEQRMNGYMNMDARLMYDYAPGVYKESNDTKEINKSVGEKVNITLQSPLSTILFKYTDLGNYTLTELGNLKSITITSWDTPLVPTTDGSSITVENPDLINVDGDWYLKSDIKVKRKTYNQMNNWVTIGPNTYDKSTCSLENGEWHVTDQSLQIANINDEDPNGDIVGWQKKNGGVSTKVKGNVIPFSALGEGSFTYNATDEKMAYVAPDELVWKAKLIIDENVGTNKEMNLFVLPVQRNGGKETYTVNFSFENADLVEERTVTKDFNANRGASTFTMNVANKFPYIVSKGNSQTADRTLYINSGKVRNVINADGSGVKWLDEWELEKVPSAYIKKVVIKEGVDQLEKTDWDALNKLTATTSLTIENNTEELLNVKGLTNLTYLKADKVTRVNKDAFNANNGTKITELYLNQVTNFPQITISFSNLEKLGLACYPFSDATKISPDKFFNEFTKATLQEVDLSAVESLAPLFAYDRTILFDGFIALTTIKLNPSGVIFTQNEFRKCTSLTTVNGLCDMDVATSAFEECSALEKVHMKGDIIPAKAFYKSGVKNIYKGPADTPAQPKYVGTEAFKYDNAIEYLDLTKAAEIEEDAFEYATKFGSNNKFRNDVVTLIVEKVKKDAFNGTSVVRFQLLNAIETEENSLNSTNLKQIKYMQDLDPLKIHANQAPARKSNTEIFIIEPLDASIFSGYKNITVETTSWAY